MFVRRSSAVQAALVAGTRTRRLRQAQINRVANAMLREQVRSVPSYFGPGGWDVDDPGESEQDTTRDYAAEERQALEAQRKRDAEAVEKQRQRE